MPETILIVDDHDLVRRSLRDWLALALPGYRLVEAASGEEAVRLAQDTLPHLVIMDIGLPRMNGIEAARRIKAAIPCVQVVMLTVQEDAAYRADAAAAGAVAYVVKRRMQTELLPTLKKALGA